jgi:adenylate kinase
MGFEVTAVVIARGTVPTQPKKMTEIPALPYGRRRGIPRARSASGSGVMENPINIALVGPTCAGKTTCATRLRTHFNLRHLSTGLLLRENFASQNALGLLTRKHVERGELVPDEIINAMLEEAVRKMSNEQGLLLDGFPSTLYQALFLENLFRETGRTLDAVVLLHVPDSAVFQRASRRVPVRPDDRPGTLRRRLRVFRRTTGPVLEFYRRGQKLIFLDATGSVESVAAAAGGVFNRLYSDDTVPVLTADQAPWTPSSLNRSGRGLRGRRSGRTSSSSAHPAAARGHMPSFSRIFSASRTCPPAIFFATTSSREPPWGASPRRTSNGVNSCRTTSPRRWCASASTTPTWRTASFSTGFRGLCRKPARWRTCSAI